MASWRSFSVNFQIPNLETVIGNAGESLCFAGDIDDAGNAEDEEEGAEDEEEIQVEAASSGELGLAEPCCASSGLKSPFTCAEDEEDPLTPATEICSNLQFEV